MVKNIWSILFLICLFSCNVNQGDNGKNSETLLLTAQPLFVDKIEAAHNKKAFLENQVVCYNLEAYFGEKKILKSKMYATTNSSKMRMDKEDGTIILFDNGKLFTNGDPDNLENDASELLRWQYFFMAPYKFSDPGVKWEILDDKPIHQKPMKAGKLIFDSNEESAYIVYAHPKTNLVHYINYVDESKNNSEELDESNISVVKYENYTQVSGIPIAGKWRFFTDFVEYKHSTLLGYAVIKNVLFLDNVDIFDIKEDPNFIQK